jgi:hypothetical protein
MELHDLKSKWTEILDRLERRNRIAWLAYFDARLSALQEGVLRLDFRDSAKLAGGHDLGMARKPEHRTALEEIIEEVTGEKVRIEEV